MIRTIIALLLALPLLANTLYSADNGTIEGRITDATTNHPVAYANVVIWGTTRGTVTDEDGNFSFTNVKPGYIEIRSSAIGYEPYVSQQLLVTNAKKAIFTISMQPANVEIEEVRVSASPYRRSEESPVSMQRLGVAEIDKSPGGNRDISKVLQNLPGVGATPSFRNDLIVRGGGGNENRFYLDGIEIPNINHFATQGASGGPAGIINVDFIRDVNFYSSAFPADRGNATSAVVEFNLIDGNPDRLKTRASVGASDLSLALDGPLGKNTTYLLSYRRSYLQFLFSALGLPFLPTYNDYQFKIKTKIDAHNEISLISTGAYDVNRLNLSANETPQQRYILNYLPVNIQWNYAIGGVYKHYYDNGFDTWVLSRNYLSNGNYKYRNNDESLDRTFDYQSSEIENKLRYERTLTTSGGIKITAGAGAEYAKYDNTTFRREVAPDTAFDYRYQTFLEMYHYHFFGQISQRFLAERLHVSFGLRADGTSYNAQMANPFEHWSPRLSLSYALSPRWLINFNTGRYQQRPAYTTLGFRDASGRLVNRDNGVEFINADHLVAGLEFLPNENTRITLEGFMKRYTDYPFSVRDSVSLSSKSAGFGIFGDEEVLSIAQGRSYGLEFLIRSRDVWGANVLVSYTLFRSEFMDYNNKLEATGSYVPTAWDNRHLLNITATRPFKGNWDIGFKWRFAGGPPYTPFDTERSSEVAVWDSRGFALPDYSQFNQKRLRAFHQLDIRVDKSYFFRTWSLIFYVDVQNVYNFKFYGQDDYLRTSIVENQPVANDPYVDPVSGKLRYQMTSLPSEGEGTLLPTLGIIVEF